MKIEYSDLAEAQSCLNVINDLQLRFTNGIQSLERLSQMKFFGIVMMVKMEEEEDLNF